MIMRLATATTRPRATSRLTTEARAGGLVRRTTRPLVSSIERKHYIVSHDKVSRSHVTRDGGLLKVISEKNQTANISPSISHTISLIPFIDQNLIRQINQRKIISNESLIGMKSRRNNVMLHARDFITSQILLNFHFIKNSMNILNIYGPNSLFYKCAKPVVTTRH